MKIKTGRSTATIAACILFVAGTSAAQQSGQSGQAGQPTQRGQSTQRDQSPRTGQSSKGSQSAQEGQSTGQSGSSRSGAMESHTGGEHGSMQAGKSDQRFVSKAAQGGMAEVELGEVAQEKGNDDVKRIGQMLVEDHGKANQQLKQIATQKGISVPASVGKHQAMIDRLSRLSGDEFNRQFLKAQAEDHRKDIKEFEKAANSLSDSDLRQFASDTLPVLRKHEQTIETAAQKMGMQMGGMGKGRMERESDGSAHHSGQTDVSGQSGRTTIDPTGSTAPKQARKP